MSTKGQHLKGTVPTAPVKITSGTKCFFFFLLKVSNFCSFFAADAIEWKAMRKGETQVLTYLIKGLYILHLCILLTIINLVTKWL